MPGERHATCGASLWRDRSQVARQSPEMPMNSFDRMQRNDEWNAGARGVIHRLAVSPDHNYFGHHGGPAGDAAVLEVESVDCVAGRGLRGDRFFDFKPDYKGQITFFALETYDALAAALGCAAGNPLAVRRNVFTRGIDVLALVGREFELQGVRFRGAEECRPCHWMDEAVAPGAHEWLKGRGGLRARILSDGVLRRGEAVLRVV
ncbi:MAG TPA: MOSC domain-containing protein [Opitutaceae bacterium]|nr:MOSC domain-containing protein [Opitutaceae bacterium]